MDVNGYPTFRYLLFEALSYRQTLHQSHFYKWYSTPFPQYCWQIYSFCNHRAKSFPRVYLGVWKTTNINNHLSRLNKLNKLLLLPGQKWNTKFLPMHNNRPFLAFIFQRFSIRWQEIGSRLITRLDFTCKI